MRRTALALGIAMAGRRAGARAGARRSRRGAARRAERAALRGVVPLPDGRRRRGRAARAAHRAGPRGVALAHRGGYRAGDRALRAWLREHPKDDFDLWIEQLPDREARLRMKRVLSSLAAYEFLYARDTPSEALHAALAVRPGARGAPGAKAPRHPGAERRAP